jgi:PAS domain S-box-containing protein
MAKRTADRSDVPDAAAVRADVEAALRERAGDEAIQLPPLPMAVYRAQLDDDLSTVWISEDIERMTGFPSRRFVDEPDFWLERVHPDDLEQTVHAFGKIVTGQTTTIEYRWRCADGTYRWYFDQPVLTHAYADAPHQMVGVWIDVTDRKEAELAMRAARDHLENRVRERTADLTSAIESLRQEVMHRREAEQALRESEERFRMLAENVPGVIYLCANDARYTMHFLNDAIEPLTGYPKQMFLDDRISFVQLYHPDDAPAIFEAVNNCIAARKPFHLIYRIHHRDGRWIWVEERGTGVYRDGELVFLEGYLSDITERKLEEQAEHEHRDRLESLVARRTAELKAINRQLVAEVGQHAQAEQALRASEKRFRSVLAAVPDLILLMGADGRYLSVFTADPQLLIAPEDELVGRRIHDVIPAEQAGPIQRAIDATLATGEMQQIEYSLDLTDGERWFSARLVPFGSDDVRSVLVVARDVTDVHHAQTQLVEHERRLQALASELTLTEERERRRIAADLHDRIGQTLSLVQIRLGALRDEMPEDVQRDEMDRLARMVQRTVDDTRTLMFDLSPPVLYDFGFEAAVEWLVERYRDRELPLLELVSDGEEKPLAQANSVLMFRATREVLINVIKHAAAKRVTVSVARDGDRVRVVVSDDGVGIDLDSTTPPHSASVGFGLFSIREQLMRQGGVMRIESYPGKGTSVILEIAMDATSSFERGLGD